MSEKDILFDIGEFETCECGGWRICHWPYEAGLHVDHDNGWINFEIWHLEEIRVLHEETEVLPATTAGYLQRQFLSVNMNALLQGALDTNLETKNPRKYIVFIWDSFEDSWNRVDGIAELPLDKAKAAAQDHSTVGVLTAVIESGTFRAVAADTGIFDIVEEADWMPYSSIDDITALYFMGNKLEVVNE